MKGLPYTLNKNVLVERYGAKCLDFMVE